MIDVASDELIHISKLTRMFPSSKGRPRAFKTIIRWILNGVEINGQRIRLDARRIGSAWYTTSEAIDTFVKAQTNAELAPYDASLQLRNETLEEINAELEADGL